MIEGAILMKIQRIWARLTIVSFTIGIVFLLLASLIGELWTVYMAVTLILIAYFLKLIKLKCQSCGWRGAPPQWSKSGTIHCPKCGKAIEYIDNN